MFWSTSTTIWLEIKWTFLIVPIEPNLLLSIVLLLSWTLTWTLMFLPSLLPFQHPKAMLFFTVTHSLPPSLPPSGSLPPVINEAVCLGAVHIYWAGERRVSVSLSIDISIPTLNRHSKPKVRPWASRGRKRKERKKKREEMWGLSPD